MTHKNVPTLECLTLGDLVVRNSGMNRDDYFKVIKTDSENYKASIFFGIKSVSDRPQAKAKRNFRHEAEMLIIDHFNGIENNFGFRKPVGGYSS